MITWSHLPRQNQRLGVRSRLAVPHVEHVEDGVHQEYKAGDDGHGAHGPGLGPSLDEEEEMSDIEHVKLFNVGNMDNGFMR